MKNNNTLLFQEIVMGGEFSQVWFRSAANPFLVKKMKGNNNSIVVNSTWVSVFATDNRGEIMYADFRLIAADIISPRGKEEEGRWRLSSTKYIMPKNYTHYY